VEVKKLEDKEFVWRNPLHEMQQLYLPFIKWLEEHE